MTPAEEKVIDAALKKHIGRDDPVLAELMKNLVIESMLLERAACFKIAREMNCEYGDKIADKIAARGEL
jgi:hypothetical protein